MMVYGSMFYNLEIFMVIGCIIGLAGIVLIFMFGLFSNEDVILETTNEADGGQCVECGNNFSGANPNYMDGVCKYCWLNCIPVPKEEKV
jgi:hypothetical protein